MRRKKGIFCRNNIYVLPIKEVCSYKKGYSISQFLLQVAKMKLENGNAVHSVNEREIYYEAKNAISQKNTAFLENQLFSLELEPIFIKNLTVSVLLLRAFDDMSNVYEYTVVHTSIPNMIL